MSLMNPHTLTNVLCCVKFSNKEVYLQSCPCVSVLVCLHTWRDCTGGVEVDTEFFPHVSCWVSRLCLRAICTPPAAWYLWFWAFSDKSLYPSRISITTDPSAKKSVCVCLCFTLNCVCEEERDRVGRSENVKHIEFMQDGFRGVCQDQLLTEALMPWNTVIFHTSSKWLFAVTDTWLWNGKNVLSEVTSLYSFSIASALCRNPVKCKSTSHLTPVINLYNCKYTDSHFSLLSRPCCHGNGLPVALKLSKCLLNNLISSLTLWVSTELF